jgi:hypothetical protein
MGAGGLTVDWRELRLRKIARQTLRDLKLRSPLDVDELRKGLGTQLGRRIDFVPFKGLVRGGHLGFLVNDPAENFIVIAFEAEASEWHQTHIQLHELGHLILRHRGHTVDHQAHQCTGLAYEFDLISPEAVEAALKYQPGKRWGLPRMRGSRVDRSLYASREEREAETIATILHEWVLGLDPEPETPMSTLLGDRREPW